MKQKLYNLSVDNKIKLPNYQLVKNQEKRLFTNPNKINNRKIINKNHIDIPNLDEGNYYKTTDTKYDESDLKEDTRNRKIDNKCNLRVINTFTYSPSRTEYYQGETNSIMKSITKTVKTVNLDLSMKNKENQRKSQFNKRKSYKATEFSFKLDNILPKLDNIKMNNKDSNKSFESDLTEKVNDVINEKEIVKKYLISPKIELINIAKHPIKLNKQNQINLKSLIRNSNDGMGQEMEYKLENKGGKLYYKISRKHQIKLIKPTGKTVSPVKILIPEKVETVNPKNDSIILLNI